MNRFVRLGSAAVIAEVVLLSSCTTNLGPETLPSTTATTTPAETLPEVTEETEIPEHTEPSSYAVVTESIVEKYGALEIDGTELLNNEGDAVTLNGISSYGIQECYDFFTSEAVKTLAEDWGCDVLRITLTGDEDSEGYIKDPERYFDVVCKVCDMCIAQGIYVIVDWNILYKEDADENSEAAIDFFTRLSAIYSETPNVIYEIENNPFTIDEEMDAEDEWSDIIKPFAEGIIEAVRENSPDCIIIVGAPDMGSAIDVAAGSQIDYDNIAYGYKLFSGTLGDGERSKVSDALDEDACVFVTEWSLGSSNGWGGVFIKESTRWIEFFREYGISWCNYAIGSDAEDASNALKLYSDRYTEYQKYSGHWPDGLLSASGTFVREQFLYVEPEETEPSGE